jgi:hypothetical protein
MSKNRQGNTTSTLEAIGVTTMYCQWDQHKHLNQADNASTQFRASTSVKGSRLGSEVKVSGNMK